MKSEEIKLRRLAGQHLLSPADTQTVTKDLCGLQAQFLGHALHGLSIRSGDADTSNLIKSWTNRGTMHLFSIDDLPLFLHEGRKHFLRPVDTLESDSYITAERKACFAKLITDGIAQGIDDRDALKSLCEKAGMTEDESKSLFDPWGGLIRALCEAGRICHKVQEKKAYQLCPEFVPLEESTAWVELTRRYFTHFGPATIKDAAYFFGVPQIKIKTHLAQLPVNETCMNGLSFYYIDVHMPSVEIPRCLFLAGFDQMMMGYEKHENIFLPQAHMRDIFNLAGIVRPALLIDGEVRGWWNLKNGKLSVTLFSDCNRSLIAEAANRQWNDIRKIDFL